MICSKIEIPSDSRWNRRYLLTVDEFAGFPKDIAQIVAEYITTHKYLDWINQTLICREYLCENPNAYYAGLVTVDDEPTHYAQNPAMRDEILANWDKCIKSRRIIENPAVFPEAMASGASYNLINLALNTHPDAIKLLVEKHLHKDECACNPKLISHINLSTINRKNVYMLANPGAISIIQFDKVRNYGYLSCNPHPAVIEHLRCNQDKIEWTWFSTNPGIFERRPDPKLLAELSESPM